MKENKVVQVDAERRRAIKGALLLFTALMAEGLLSKVGAGNDSNRIIQSPDTLQHRAGYHEHGGAHQHQRDPNIVRKARFISENCTITQQATQYKAKKLSAEKIVACNACVAACPRKAIKTKLLAEGTTLTQPLLDEELCIGCGRCVRTCPTDPKAWEIWDKTNNKKLF